MWRILFITLALCLFFSVPALAYNTDYTMVVDGIQVYPDVGPVVAGMKVLVPLRAVAEATGAVVQFVDSSRELIINRHGLEVRLYLDNYSGYKNGDRLVLTSPIKIINDRSFVTREQLEQLLDVRAYLNIRAKSIVVQSQ